MRFVHAPTVSAVLIIAVAVIGLGASPAAAQSETDSFITTWQTTRANETITLPVVGYYTVNWGDGMINATVAGSQEHRYNTAGTYTVSVSGDLTRINLRNDAANAAKLQSIEQWGDMGWTTMKSSFKGASSMTYNATDVPDLSRVTDMSGMFEKAYAFNGDISGWDVSRVTDMGAMFANTRAFHGNLSGWDVSRVTDMSQMFYASKFNGDISGWDVSRVTDMSGMFTASSFNNNISEWDVSSVTDMFRMFIFSSFNGDISEWDVSSVTDMGSLFWFSSFNGDISGWDVSSVTGMSNMFSSSDFEGNLGGWYITLDNTSITGIPQTVGEITAQNRYLAGQRPTYDIGDGGNSGNFGINGTTLILNTAPADNPATVNITSAGGFGTSNSHILEIYVTPDSTSNLTVNAGPDQAVSESDTVHLNGTTANYVGTPTYTWTHNSTLNIQLTDPDDIYTTFIAPRVDEDTTVAFTLTVNYGDFTNTDSTNVVIGDTDAMPAGSFVTIWKTTEPDESILIPVGRSLNTYTVDWGDGTVSTNVSGDRSHRYAVAGSYPVSISGDFERIHLGASAANAKKLQSIEQWGDIRWSSMTSAFSTASNMAYNAVDSPDLSGVTRTSYMFHASSFNGDISEWDVSSVADMSGMFWSAPFNGDLSKWNVSSVTDMSYMFYNSGFRGDISEWDVSSVTRMPSMFSFTYFNGDLSEWDVSSVTDMGSLFVLSSFNGDLSKWDVSSATDMDSMFWFAPFRGNLGSWYITLNDTSVPRTPGPVGNISAQNEFLAEQRPVYRIGSGGDSEHFGINGTTLVLKTVPDSNPATVKITSKRGFGTSNSHILEIFFTSNSVNSLAVDAGPNQAVFEGATVHLNGTAANYNGTPTYAWTHNSTLDIPLTNPADLSTTFTAPQVDEDTTAVFTLTVSDEAASVSDHLTVIIANSTVQFKLDEPVDPQGISGITLNSTLPGTVDASWDAPEKKPRDYRISWALVGESYKAWDDETGNAFPANPSYTITDLEEDGEYKMQVRARYAGGDSGDWSGQSTVTVMASPSNAPATGVPTVTGTARTGETLTADTSGIADADGMTNAALSYQWISGDGTDDADIAGATASTYVLTAGDQGSTIKVRVTFTDDAGHQESLTSAATQAVASDSAVPGAPTGLGVLPNGGGTLDVSWQPPASNGGSNLTGYTVQWKAASGAWTAPADVTEAAVTGTAHTITGLTGGTSYTVRVIATNGVGDGAPSAEERATPQAPASPHGPRDIGVITMSGTPPGTVHLSWGAPDEAPANYRVSWALAGESYLTWTDLTGNAFPTVPLHTITGLEAGQTYKTKVRASYDGTAGDWSGEIVFTVAGTPAVSNIPAANAPATGLPVITGTAEVGQTLAADASGIADADGMANATLSYQWISGDGTDDADIAGATASTYVLTAGNQGSTIKVRVTFTDDAGHAESLTSAATQAVVPVPAVPGAPTGLGVLPNGSGTLDVSWQPPTSDGGSSLTGYTVQWKAASGAWTTPSDVTEDTVTGTTHTITGLTDGTSYAVRVIATNGVGDGVPSAEETATPQAPAPPRGPREIGGIVLNSTIPGVIDISWDAPSQTPTNYRVMWAKVGESYLTWTDLTGNAFPTAPSHTITGLEDDRQYKIKVRTVYDHTPGDWSDEVTATTAAGTVIVPNTAVETVIVPNTPATGLPVITGTAEVGQTLRTDISGIADADGMTNATLSYQWISGDGTDDADIAGATASAYVLTAGDLDSTVKVTITFTDDAGHQESLTSAATLAVAPVPAVPNTPATGLPVITGTAEVGQTLRTDISGIADADGMTNATLSYQWISGDGTDDADIAGATTSAYVLTAGDLDSTVKVTITFTDDAGHQESLASAATLAVAPVPAVPNTPATGLPVITGTAEVGQTLRTDISGIADADGMINATLSYQWISGDGTDDADIAGATASAYVLAAGDLDSTVKVTITFTDDAGHQESLTSAATLAVASAPVTAVVETSRQFITTWQTTLAGESITIPVGGATGIYTVDWGDGNADHDVSGDRRHAYDDAGTYTVRISGDFTRIYLNGDQPNAGKLQSIEQWGDVRWESMESAFQGASSMVYRADDAPDLSDVASMRYMFEDAAFFDGDLSDWDVSSVTDMTRMFDHASRFSGDLSDWDVSGVTTMDYMFHDAFAFNGNISAWDVSGVTDMRAMFRNAFYFNSDLSAWDVSGVTDMRAMFRGAVEFNDNISAWNVSGATKMRNMFSGSDAFDQNLGKWYIVLDDTVIEGGNLAGAIGRIAAQNQFLDGQNPTYRIGSGADSEHFEIDGTALKLKKAAQNSLASGSYTVTITSTGEFGTGNSRTYEIVVADT